MNKLIIVTLASLFATGVAFAEPPVGGDNCETRAVSKEGKPLAGAAKAAFMKKCERDAGVGAAPSAKTGQQEKMKTCNKEAVGKKGAERKQFMSECLKKS